MKRPSKGAHVRKPKPVTRDDLRQAYRELGAVDVVAAGGVLLEYGLARVHAERDDAPAPREGRDVDDWPGEL